MRLQVTRKQSTAAEPGVMSALLDCHTRIRRFMAVALRLTAVPAGTPPADIAEAAAGVSRYFGEALPRHEADEEESLRPRVAGRDATVDSLLDEMTRQHDGLHGPTATLIEITAGVAAAPETLAGDTEARLTATVETLRPLWDEHLELEEKALFPALERLLTEQEMAEVRAEMRERR